MKYIISIILTIFSANLYASTRISCIIEGKVESITAIPLPDADDFFEVSMKVTNAYELGASWEVCSDYIAENYEFNLTMNSEGPHIGDDIVVHYYLSDSDGGFNRIAFNRLVKDIDNYIKKNEVLLK